MPHVAVSPQLRFIPAAQIRLWRTYSCTWLVLLVVLRNHLIMPQRLPPPKFGLGIWPCGLPALFLVWSFGFVARWVLTSLSSSC
jgi:hypothetical protein